MKIAMDIQSTLCNKTGIGYYVQNLIGQLEKMDDIEVGRYSWAGKKDLNTLERLYWENVRLPSLVKDTALDILHIPGFAGPVGRSRTKKVTTIHDLIGMIYPDNLNFASRFYWQKWLPLCVKNSDFIIAVSENTKKDIVRLLNIPEERIEVILIAVDERFFPVEDEEKFKSVRLKYSLPEEFILTVGTVEPRKNICSLIEAVALYMKEEKSGLNIVIAGKKDWGYNRLLEKTEELKMADRVRFTNYVDEEDMAVIYSMAKFFVYPSFYEGFGLPVLEALSCGAPVISSNVSSLPEVTGEASVLIDPHDVYDLKKAIKKLDRDSALRNEMAEKSLRQSKKFTWGKTALQTLEVYKRCVGANK